MSKSFILTLIGVLLLIKISAQIPRNSTLLVPVTVNLQPLYKLAEKAVDSIYTSDGYPDGWQQEECEVRYKYTFRRGPLQIKAQGNQFQLGFTGYFKIIGAVRACFDGKPITGWAPPCRCGFEEGEIPVLVQFTGKLSLLQNYQLKVDLGVQEPKPQGKCEVCFWKMDITSKVMKGIKKELLLAKKEIDQKYGMISFRNEFDTWWQKLQAPVPFSTMGYFHLRPEAIHINQFKALDDTLYLQVGLSANPLLTLHNQVFPIKALSPIKPISNLPGFSIELEARLQYDSLTALLQRNIQGQIIELKKGLIQKKFVIDSIFLQDSYSGNCLLKVYFSGTDRGIAYVRAKPLYDSMLQEIGLEPADITLHSNNKLIDLTDKLFQEKLKKEITIRAKFSLMSYFQNAKEKLTLELNREWVKGVKGKGTVTDIQLKTLEAASKDLRILLKTNGQLLVTVSEASLSL